MEEEIMDKLEQIYNNYIRIEVNNLKDNKFEIIGTIRITKGEIIRLSFNFEYTYFKDATMEVNIFYICKEIDKHIIKLFKEE